MATRKRCWEGGRGEAPIRSQRHDDETVLEIACRTGHALSVMQKWNRAVYSAVVRATVIEHNHGKLVIMS
jgi:hypothetical protein